MVSAVRRQREGEKALERGGFFNSKDSPTETKTMEQRPTGKLASLEGRL